MAASMTFTTLEGIKFILSALNLGLLNEAIFLSECIFLGVREPDWELEDILSALKALIRLEQDSDPSIDQRVLVEFLNSLNLIQNVEEYLKSSEFVSQILHLLTEHFKVNFSCHGIHAIIDQFNILQDEIALLDFSSLLNYEDRFGPFAGSYRLDLELGKAFLNLSKYKNARSSLERAFSTNPYSNRYYDLYSTVLWHLNEKAVLFAVTLDCNRKWPNTPESMVVQGNYYSLIMANEMAIECFRKAHELDENYGYSYFLEGYDWLSLNNLDEAENAFAKLRKIEPENYMSYFGLGIVNFKKGNPDVALKYLHFASTKNPVHINIKCYTSLVYDSLGDKETALQTLLKIDSKTSFSSPVLAYQLSKLYHSLNMPLKEEYVLNQAIQNFPNDAALFFSLAGIKKDQDDISGAVQLLKKAYELDLSNPLAKEHINSIGI